MRILLLCSLGISVEALRNRILEEIHQEKLSIQVGVSAISEAFIHGADADIILLTPQVKYNYHKIKNMFPKKCVLKISEEDFAEANGKKVMRDILNQMKKSSD